MADRTVTTHLVAKVGRYVAPMREADRATHSVTEELHDAARAGKDFGRQSAVGAGTAAAAFTTAGVAATGLEGRIDDTKRSLRELIREFERTGDVTLFKNIRDDRSMLSTLNRMRKELGNIGDEGGRSMMSGLASHLARLAPLLKGFAITGGVAAGVALAPLLGGIVGAAVLGGIGAGGIIGGIALAARDARVKTAAETFADRVGDAFGTAASPFVGPIVDSLRILGDGAERLARQAGGIFRQLAPELRGLTFGLVGLVENMMPGIRAAAEAARPLLRLLARELPQIGNAISEMFTRIARESPGAILALNTLLDVTESAIIGVGNVIAFLSNAFEKVVRVAEATSNVAEDVWGWVPILGDQIKGGNDHMEELIATMEGLKNESYNTAEAGKGLTQTLEEQKAATDKLVGSIAELFSLTMSAEEANARYEESWDNLSSSLRGSNKSLDDGTAKGRANRDMIRQHIQAIEANRNAYVRQTGDVRGGTVAYQRQIDKLRDLLVKRGFEKAAIDRIIGAYRNIPANATTNIRTPGMSAALERIRAYREALNRIPASVFSTVYVNRLDKGRRWGGITEHAQTGLLRDAAVYSPQGPARYAFAEPATGGEAFIPKFGPYGRAMSVLSQAANWYGADVVPGRGGAMTLTLSTSGSGRPVERALGDMFMRLLHTGTLELTVGSDSKVRVAHR